jgi:hypothetical protein
MRAAERVTGLIPRDHPPLNPVFLCAAILSAGAIRLPRTAEAPFVIPETKLAFCVSSARGGFVTETAKVEGFETAPNLFITSLRRRTHERRKRGGCREPGLGE